MYIKKDRIKKIRVLHIAASTAGGVGLLILYLMKFLDRRVFEQKFVCGTGYPLDETFLKEGMDIRFIRLSRRPMSFSNLIGFFQIYRLLRKEQFDIVHTHTSVGGFYGRIAAKLNRIPSVIWSIHGYGSHVGHKPWKRKIFQVIEKIMDHLTDHYIAISRSIKEEGVSRGITTPDKVKIIYNTIDLNRFSVITISEEFLRACGSFPIIGTIARLEPQKGIEYLIKSVPLIKRSVPSIKVLVVGDGPLREKLEKMADDLNVSNSIFFLGWRTDIAEILSVMDVFCAPSLWEGFGMVLLEAMAMKKPVVASEIGGIPEVVKNNETGILVPPANFRSFATAVTRLLKDRELAVRMGEAGRKRVEKEFIIEKMINDYYKIYLQFLLEGREDNC